MQKNEPFPPRNYIIISELRSAAPLGAFEAAVMALGRSYRLNKTTWFVQAETTLGSVRNAIAPHLSATDSLVIVDVGEGRKLVWQHGPEADAHLRAIWAKPEVLPVVERRVERRRVRPET